MFISHCLYQKWSFWKLPVYCLNLNHSTFISYQIKFTFLLITDSPFAVTAWTIFEFCFGSVLSLSVNVACGKNGQYNFDPVIRTIAGVSPPPFAMPRHGVTHWMCRLHVEEWAPSQYKSLMLICPSDRFLQYGFTSLSIYREYHW